MKNNFIVMSITRYDLSDEGHITEEQAEALTDEQMQSIAYKVAEYFDDEFQKALSSAVREVLN